MITRQKYNMLYWFEKIISIDIFVPEEIEMVIVYASY